MNVLLTSAGRRSYLVEYFKEALGDEGIVIAANSEDCPAFYSADESLVTPLIYDDGYIPFLLNYCKSHDVDLLVPLFDIDIPVLAENIHEFAEIGTQVVVADSEVARICNDKWVTFEFLKSAGIPVPETALGLDETKKALQDGSLAFPLMVKPRWGMGSIGLIKASNLVELEGAFSIIGRQISSSYLRYESEADSEHAVLAQEIMDGQEYGVDIMSDLACNVQGIVVRKKLGMRAGETDSARIETNETIVELAKRLAELLPHPGNLDVDMFLCNDKAFVLELNARFGGGYPFSHVAGANLPEALIRWYKGDLVPDDLLRAEEGLVAFKDISIRTV